MLSVKVFLGLVLITAFVSVSSAKEKGDAAEESMNPLSTVISLPFENNTLFNLGPSKSTANVLNFKPVFPTSLGEFNLINRVVAPIIYAQGQDRLLPDDIFFGGGHPGSFGIGEAFGLGDVTYQGFITPKKSGDIAWGLGGSLVLPTHTKKRFGTNKYSAGPAAVLFASPGNWVIGLIAENIWSFAGDDDVADVNVFSLQVAVNYKLKNRWYLTTAPLFSANWKAEKNQRWTVPLGGGIGRVFKLRNKKILAVDVGAYYNVEKSRFANNWYSQILVNFLFPK